MKDYELLDAVGGVEADLVTQAGRYGAQKNPMRAVWAAVAACLCLAAVLAAPKLHDALKNKGDSFPNEQV